MSGLARRQQEFLAALLDEEAPLPAGWQVRHARGLAIYRNNYRGGLIDTLRDTYPRTEVLAGEAAFARAAAHHCITHPPSSWTLDCTSTSLRHLEGHQDSVRALCSLRR